jgi:CHAD domain-containing protein
MTFRLEPGLAITQSVRQAGTEQIDRALSKLAGKAKKGNAVHETRKAIKRLRALLHLIKPAMRKADFRIGDARLKQIAKSLSGVREIQAMIETVAKLDAYDEQVGRGPVASQLRAHLEEMRDAAETSPNGSGAERARKLLKQARHAFDKIELESDDFAVLAKTVERDYRKARDAYKRAYELGEDEAFHDWRKYVQRHWRQLLLVAPGWPKALRPHIALARDLSEILGEDHDLYILSQFVEQKAASFGSPGDVEAFLALCGQRQQELRILAQDMGARLFAEKPSSLALRLTVYWMTVPPASGKETETVEEDDEPSNIIPLTP